MISYGNPLRIINNNPMRSGGINKPSTLYLAPIRGMTDQIYRNAFVRHFQVQTWMLGRGLLANPLLAEELHQGISLTPDQKRFRLQIFHDDLLEGYRGRLSGPTHQLQHLRGHWEYLQHAVPNGDKLMRKIRKAKTVADYHRQVDMVFRNPWADLP